MKDKQICRELDDIIKKMDYLYSRSIIVKAGMFINIILISLIVWNNVFIPISLVSLIIFLYLMVQNTHLSEEILESLERWIREHKTKKKDR